MHYICSEAPWELGVIHWSCYWGTLECAVFAHYTCCWSRVPTCGPFQKQSVYILLLGALWKQRTYTLQQLLGAVLKVEYLHIAAAVGGAFENRYLHNAIAIEDPFQSRLAYLHNKVAGGGPFESTARNYDVHRKILYERIISFSSIMRKIYARNTSRRTP